MWFASKSRRSQAALLTLGIASATAAQASPERWDPTVVREFSLARIRTSTRSSDFNLPLRPEVVWRVRVASAVPFAPTPTSDGSVVLGLATPVVAEYDARGRLLWTARLGASNAATSLIVLGDGARMVLTQAGEAISFSPRGQVLRRHSLPLPALEAPPLVAPTPDGGMFIAAGRRVLQLDASLGVVATARADQDVRAILPAPSRSLIVLANGNVLELARNGGWRRVASFNARVDAAVRRGDDSVLALVDGRRLVELNVATQLPTTHFAETDVEFSPLLVQNTPRGLRLMSNLDFVFAFGDDSREVFRVALPSANAATRATLRELTFDDVGATLIARSGVDLVAVHADGALQRVEGTACTEPLSPVGAAPGYAVFACRSGILMGIAERAVTGKAK
ncbi:MAG TPA: hypothetical protein VFQ35_19145 [Polyangiaceae bacterium]|nr:hypothetical protein [Polyangiaceae bacterium]